MYLFKHQDVLLYLLSMLFLPHYLIQRSSMTNTCDIDQSIAHKILLSSRTLTWVTTSPHPKPLALRSWLKRLCRPRPTHDWIPLRVPKRCSRLSPDRFLTSTVETSQLENLNNQCVIFSFHFFHTMQVLFVSIWTQVSEFKRLWFIVVYFTLYFEHCV